MYLIDTNIFLEILLEQEKEKDCTKFLEEIEDECYISDFSLHSIGVILFRMKKDELFLKFLNDMFLNTEIIRLSPELYNNLPEIRKSLDLDFDDTYQMEVAKKFNLKIVTLDSDFKKVQDKIEVMGILKNYLFSIKIIVFQDICPKWGSTYKVIRDPLNNKLKWEYKEKSI